jgi:hypothetical protein
MSRRIPRPTGSLKAGDLAPVVASLKKANASVAAAFPGETGDRQPVHTVYGGAHLFRSDTTRKLLNFFVRGLNSGALTLDEARETGLTPQELQARSFLKILETRRR